MSESLHSYKSKGLENYSYKCFNNQLLDFDIMRKLKYVLVANFRSCNLVVDK